MIVKVSKPVVELNTGLNIIDCNKYVPLNWILKNPILILLVRSFTSIIVTEAKVAVVGKEAFIVRFNGEVSFIKELFELNDIIG